jgi:hypothetical protein
MLITGLSGLFFLLALYAAYTRNVWKLMSFGGFAVVFKLWFLGRMVVYYDEYLAHRPWWRKLLGS